MRMELVSKLGVRLPGGGLLEFGTTRDRALLELQRLEQLERFAEFGTAPTAFVRGTAWTGRVRLGDRWLEASAGPDGLLAEIRVARAIEAPWHAPTAVPVLYRGIDVFDRPIAEIEFLLDAMDPGAERDLRLTGVSGYALSATLTDPGRADPLTYAT
jgi:hypothetical protein